MNIKSFFRIACMGSFLSFVLISQLEAGYSLYDRNRLRYDFKKRKASEKTTQDAIPSEEDYIVFHQDAEGGTYALRKDRDKRDVHDVQDGH